MTPSLRELEFVDAARALGASDRWIIPRHVVPDVSAIFVVDAGLTHDDRNPRVVFAVVDYCRHVRFEAARWWRSHLGEVSGMDRDVAMEQLATAHAVALRLRDRGEPDDVIAHALAMPSEAVPHLLTIADAKLAALLDSSNHQDDVALEPRPDRPDQPRA